MATSSSAVLRVYTVRFLPDQELKASLEEFVLDNSLHAAFVMTCVGSVRKATLRFATQPPGPRTEKLSPHQEMEHQLQVFTVSFKKGDDLKDCLGEFVAKRNLGAPFIIMCKGIVNCVILSSNSTTGPPFPAEEECYTIRLLPGQDLKEEIETFVEKNNLEAAFIMTCVGSINGGTLRFPIPKTGPIPAANRELTYKREYFDILSLVGTVSQGGSHLHVVLGRADGTVVGGHLVGNAKVHTTAEVVIGECLTEVYIRKNDPNTTFNELEVKPRSR